MSNVPAWRSLDELDAAAALPALTEAALIDRRMALRLMAASAALAGVAACDRPLNRALRSRPRGQSDGRTVEYATTLDHGGGGFGVLVRTADGHPVKIEGNPLHPSSRGGSDVRAQLELLSLYDPDRSRAPVGEGRPRSWGEARRTLAAWREAARRTRGEGLHILMRPSSSPTLARLVAELRSRFPAARLHGWNPLAAEERGSLRPLLGEAELVVCLGADPLGPGPDQVRLARDWAERRAAGLAAGRLPRLVVAESVPTLTGARADTRLPLAPDAIAVLAGQIAAGEGSPAAMRIAAALREAGSRSLVLAGPEQVAAVHAAARALNLASGAFGVTCREVASPGAALGLEPIETLTAAIDGGTVRTLLVLGGNPAYDAPADLGLPVRLRRVAQSLHLGLHRDETAAACRWHLPARHALERWGDTQDADGVVGLTQPVTAPLAGGLSEIELLGLLVGEPGGGRGHVSRTWAGRFPEEQWLRTLEAGMFQAEPPARPAQSTPAPVAAGRREGLTLFFRPAAHLVDGALANNAWAQELPDPITKLVWGNAATLAPATAAALGLSNGDEIAITTRAGTVNAPVWILPGQAADTVAVTLGYGREAAGTVGSGVGFNAFRLRSHDEPWSTSCTVRQLGTTARLVSTERHHATDDADAARRIAPGAALPPPAGVGPSLYTTQAARSERRWGMVIDLDRCIGCAACTVACQAENNIPVVGPDEVASGREMHWLRVDRSWRGDAAAPSTDFQPVPCMHCETAPCEPVCPVGATVHSSEGVNQMTYSRCIGTRTCSNACPYKVRRYNWFDYQDRELATPEPARNPRVTVRERGVMEKCTYCAQRIEAVHAGDAPGPPVTACQQACPTNAIVFGDLADPESAVAAARASPRNYALLDGLNLAPRTTYLARVEADDG